MASEAQSIVQLLQATLDPKTHKQAEAALKVEESKPGFSLLLLNIVASEFLPLNIRLSGALCFKNFIKYNWVDESDEYKLAVNEVVTIKKEVIGLMISVPASLQLQLGETISLIANSDFWRKWDTLVDDLVSRLTSDNPKVNVGVLEVAHSIFKRWRPLFRTDELYTEINHVLSKFGQPFVDLLANTDQQITANKDNKDTLKQYILVMNLLVKLFYDLSSQDLPPIFEDKLASITSLLHKYLTYENPLLLTDDDSEAGPLEFLKAGICEVMTLYIQKYEDVFGELCKPFITSTWLLLTSVSSKPKFDILVSKALHFLTAAASLDVHAQNFNNDEDLSLAIEKVIIPNISLRESDIEQFEDEPIDFIRRDLEGSDADTRRRAATDFLQKLLEKFVERVTTVVGRYITHYLNIFGQSPANEWKSKDTAIYLFSCIAITGANTAGHGVKATNNLVDIVDFFQKNIATDLITDTGVEPILKVDAIKFLYTFRSQLTKAQWGAAFQPLVKNLASSNYVVYTYASIAVEKVLSLTTDGGKNLFEKDEIAPFSKDLLEHLFQLIERESAPEKIQENEFLMRCVMRVLFVIKDSVLPIADSVLPHLIKITEIISQNPSNPKFYFYHFEALGALIRFAAPNHPKNLENDICTPLVGILQNDVQEFMPYVFQLFAALLECRPKGSLPHYHQDLFDHVLTSTLWESRGNIPALARLLSSLLSRSSSEIMAGRVDRIIEISRILTGKVRHELYVYAFDILEALIEAPTSSSELPTIEAHFPNILTILLSRLNPKSPDRYKQRFIRFYHLVSSRNESGMGADFYIRHAESLQSGVFTNIYLNYILPVTQQLTRPLDRKLAVISLTKTLTDSQSFAEIYTKSGWAKTCYALLELLENPPVPVVHRGYLAEVDVDFDDLSFGVGFTPLNTCKKSPKDDWPEVTDVKSWVVSYLNAANTRHNGKIANFINQRLSLEAQKVLASYMQ
ncbi:Importin alpha re-exporter [Podosphaera aphanis]|nr:Importin alpha re-exporter [Podosphaera aphanis]